MSSGILTHIFLIISVSEFLHFFLLPSEEIFYSPSLWIWKQILRVKDAAALPLFYFSARTRLLEQNTTWSDSEIKHSSFSTLLNVLKQDCTFYLLILVKAEAITPIDWCHKLTEEQSITCWSPQRISNYRYWSLEASFKAWLTDRLECLITHIRVVVLLAYLLAY